MTVRSASRSRSTSDASDASGKGGAASSYPVRRRVAVVTLASALVGLSLAGLTGCGLPRGGVATVVPSEQVPAGLISPSPTTTATVDPTDSRPGTVYFVDDQQRLVPRSVEVTDARVETLVQSLLTRLAVGPTDRERALGLATDLGSEVTVTLRSVKGGTATVELSSQAQDSDPNPVRFPVAIGQVVLTATSVVGIDRVSIVQADGTPANVPVPPLGELSTTPLTAVDYRSSLASGVVVPERLTPAG